ncbi:hypothetical protein HAX54_017214 [Datura stramonium]|uniref:Uncharacterized protein n=1 Tax=Datura stramonium TaxID=4076 RepID=A0ABS8UN65_DATST|nr:hypothetical protein [Datura stramonium]
MAPGEGAAMPLMNRMVLRPSFDSDGRHRSHETGPLLLRKSPAPSPSLPGEKSGVSHLVLAQCAPFFGVPCPVHWAVGLPSTCPLLLPPLGGRSARYPDFSLCWGPPIAIAMLWQLQLATTGARLMRPEWASWSASIRIMLGSFAFARSREILQVLRPRFHRRGHLSTGTTKKSHADVTVIDGLIILDHEDPSRASGFHSNHIDDKSLVLCHKNLESVSWVKIG